MYISALDPEFDKAKFKKSFPLRLKSDMQTFISSCTVRLQCPFPLKYAFRVNGTLLQDLSQVEPDDKVLILSRYPNLVLSSNRNARFQKQLSERESQSTEMLILQSQRQRYGQGAAYSYDQLGSPS